MRSAVLAIAVSGSLVLAACLSDPGGGDGRPPDGGPGFDGGGAAIDAAPGARDDAGTVPAGNAFPPADVVVAVDHGTVTDVNGDGIDDLLLTSRTGLAAENGVYVLLGQSNRGVPEFHQFIATGEIEVRAVTAGPFGATSGLDLLALGVDYNDPGEEFDNDPVLLAYLRQPTGAWASAPLTRDLDAGDACAPPRDATQGAAITTGRFAPDATLPGIAITHDRGICLVQPDAMNQAAFGGSARTSVSRVYPGTEIRAIPSATPNVDDLLIQARTDSVFLYRNDGTGQFGAADLETPFPAIWRADPLDADGVGPLDLMGVNGSGLILQIVGAVDHPAFVWQGDPNTPGFDDFLDVAVVDTGGGDDRPDVVVLATGCFEAGGGPCLALLHNVYVDSAILTSDVDQTLISFDAGFVPSQIFAGDFDGDGIREIRVFATNGTHRCFTPTDDSLATCDVR